MRFADRPIIEWKPVALLSILSMRFSKMSGSENELVKLFFQFSLWDSRCKCYECIPTRRCNLSILSMRFEVKLTRKPVESGDPFNSLYEIPEMLNAPLATSPEGLSILSMRFFKRRINFRTLYFQFSLWDSLRLLSLIHQQLSAFQFSLWDSRRLSIDSNVEDNITFNSLYEIHAYSCTLVEAIDDYDFQFSLWDSWINSLALWSGVIAFNSLYEILSRN